MATIIINGEQKKCHINEGTIQRAPFNPDTYFGFMLNIDTIDKKETYNLLRLRGVERIII
jgi:hypothetical protein